MSDNTIVFRRVKYVFTSVFFFHITGGTPVFRIQLLFVVVLYVNVPNSLLKSVRLGVYPLCSAVLPLALDFHWSFFSAGFGNGASVGGLMDIIPTSMVEVEALVARMSAWFDDKVESRLYSVGKYAHYENSYQ